MAALDVSALAEILKEEEEGSEESMQNLLEWETRKAGGEWEGVPTYIAVKLSLAFKKGATRCTFELTDKGAGFRKGDPAKLSYTVDFTTMTQHCVQHPTRRRSVRRVNRDVQLTKDQLKAISFVEQVAAAECGLAKHELFSKLGRIGHGPDHFCNWIVNSCPLIIHVKLNHVLDGRKQSGTTVIDKFLQDTHYRSIFETGTGRGSTNTSNRKEWERDLFGGAYPTSKDGSTATKPFERPKYGTINLTNHPLGVLKATCYGTSYLVLAPHVRWRCTITSRDSCRVKTDAVPGSLRQFYRFSNSLSDSELKAVAEHDSSKRESLGVYREVQIHGPIRFDRDISEIVADNRYESKDQEKVNRFAKKHHIPIRWVEGPPVDDEYFRRGD